MDHVVELGALITKLRQELRMYERELASLLGRSPGLAKTKQLVGKPGAPPPLPKKPRKEPPAKSTKPKPKPKSKSSKPKPKPKTPKGKLATHESGSTTARIVKLMRDAPQDVFDAAEVARHLGAKVESVRTMLKRLVESGDLRKTGRGAFRAR